MNLKNYYTQNKKKLLSLDQFEEKNERLEKDEVLEAYIEYLNDYFEPSKTIAFRWALQEETNDIYDLDNSDGLDDMGSYWAKSTHNSHYYDTDVKYMHFFTDIKEKDNILLSIDDEEDHGGGQNQCPRFLQIHQRAFPHLNENALKRRHPVGRQLHDEHFAVPFEKRRFEQQRAAERHHHPDEIHDEHHHCLILQREKRRNDHRINRQPRPAAHEGNHQNRRQPVAC